MRDEKDFFDDIPSEKVTKDMLDLASHISQDKDRPLQWPRCDHIDTYPSVNKVRGQRPSESMDAALRPRVVTWRKTFASRALPTPMT